jgi:hypothetical protein
MRGVSGVSKGGATTAGARAAGSRSAGGGFSVGGTAGANGAAAAATGAASAAAAVGGSLLAVQETGDRAGRDAAARRRGHAILDELRGLQAELLGGRAPDPARLARLAASGAGEEGADPGLREAVRAVALRARIELARRSGNAAMDRSAMVP